MFFMPPMSLGLTRYSRAGGSGIPFDPSILFANGEQGAWYDPSDLSTLFQDVSGTTPALPGDPVGLVLDKSGNGINLSQPTASARPTLARMPLTGRRNLLTYTEDFSNAVWNKTAGIVVTPGVPDPLGGNTATRINFGAENRTLTQTIPSLDGSNRTGSLWVKGVAGETIRLNFGAAGTVTLTGSWQEFTQSPTLGTALVSLNTFSGVTARVVDVWHPQLEPGSVKTPYQKVTSPFDITEEGVPDYYYLRPDLTDDALTTVLPQAINGDILIAGRNGTIIEPVSYAAGSTFSLGPTNYTGGTPGILAAIGNIVAVLLIDKTLTQLERDNLLAYYQAKGAGGLL